MRVAIRIAVMAGLLAPMLGHAITIAEAKRMIAAQLKDPSSAQFRNVRAYKQTGAICGEYNAKNAFGGYVGFAPFGFDREGHPMDAPHVEGLNASYVQAATSQFLRECEGERHEG